MPPPTDVGIKKGGKSLIGEEMARCRVRIEVTN